MVYNLRTRPYFLTPPFQGQLFTATSQCPYIFKGLKLSESILFCRSHAMYLCNCTNAKSSSRYQASISFLLTSCSVSNIGLLYKEYLCITVSDPVCVRLDPDPFKKKNRSGSRISHFFNQFRWKMRLSYNDSQVEVPAELYSTLQRTFLSPRGWFCADPLYEF